MNSNTAMEALPARQIIRKARGQSHGPIVRLMSPSDLGQILKPFVFLDLVDVDPRMPLNMGIHPHSGIATTTVFTEGVVRFDDPEAGTGHIAYGGVEWMRAGGGVWHGKELSPASTTGRIQGFQLWIALPPELENGPVECQYVEAQHIPTVGPARLILGTYEGTRSPVNAPTGVNYLLLTLKPGEHWTYQPPAGHAVAWLAVASGGLAAAERLAAGDMAVFAPGEVPIHLKAESGANAVFVLGSAVPHPHDLALGYYSVHTSGEALRAGEAKIAELEKQLSSAGNRRTSTGVVPVFK